MSREVKEWAQWQLEEFYPEYHGSVNEVFKKMFYPDLPFNEKYSPIKRRVPEGKEDDQLMLHVNIRKQIVKAPRLHFLDTGLVCLLLQIREPGQLRLHPLRGAIFESWEVSELYKAPVHQGEQPILHHYRESRGLEMDVWYNVVIVCMPSRSNLRPQQFPLKF